MVGTLIHRPLGFVSDAWRAILAQTTPVGTDTPGTAVHTNVSSVTSYLCMYSRIGAFVTVSGQIDIDAVAADTNTLFYMNVPILYSGGNFVSAAQASGVFTGHTVKSQSGGIYAAVGTPNVLFQYIPTVTFAVAHHFIFTYQV